MFVRILEGPVISKPLLRNGWDHLNEALARHGSWVGSTAGIERHHTFFACIRIESAADAAELFDSEMVSFWWEELLRHIEDPEIAESSDVEILIPGGETEAGFVQVLHGHTTDKAQMRTMNRAMQEVMLSHRPDVLGSMLTWLDDDRFTEIVYFTSEQDARSAESTEFPGGVQALFGELMQVMDDLRYMDLPDPWLFTPSEDPAPLDTRRQAFRPTKPSVAGGDEVG